MSTILVVDGQPKSQKSLVNMLGYAGHRVIVAARGAEALDAARVGRPDLVITDVETPELDGVRFLRELRKDPAFDSTELILYAASERLAEAKPLAEELAVRYLLQKPAAPEEILNTVAKALDETPVVCPSRIVGLRQAAQGEAVRQLPQVNLDCECQLAHITTIIELTHDLASQDNTQDAVAVACRAARSIGQSNYAAVAMLNPHDRSIRCFASDAANKAKPQTLSPPSLDNKLLAEVLDSGRAIRLHAPSSNGVSLLTHARALTPHDLHPVRSLLAVPVRSQQREWGCLWLINKKRASQFTDEDERLISTLAELLGLLYENKVNMEELLGATETLRRKNEDLDQFAYIASHDLQEPLRRISASCQALADEYSDKLDQNGREWINFAVTGTSRMKQLVDDLLVYSCADSLTEQIGPVDAHAAFTQAMENLAEAVEESHAEIHSQPLPFVMATELQLAQLFQNLVGNAVKYRGEAPPRIEISVAEEDGMWRFSVADNGIGIDPRFHDRVFEVLQRLHSKDTYPGTGLGLALCKKIVERLGGEIWVDSAPGEGSVFSFTLPQAERVSVEPNLQECLQGPQNTPRTLVAAH